ncbi:MAG: signal peptide peptidase SppA [Thermoanaerobaculia bacterium]
MKKLLIIFLLLLTLAILVAVVGILVSRGGATLPGEKILTLTLDRPVHDYQETPSFSWIRRGSPQSMADLWAGLARARNDPQVVGLSVYLRNARFGFGKAQELRYLLESFQESERFVNCFLETAGEGTNGTLAYFLVSACDHITLAPLGDINLVGLFSDAYFLKGTLEKLKIETDLSHAGQYKSAAEQFTNTAHSPAAEEALSSVLDDLFDQIVTAIAEDRDLTVEAVRDLIDRAPLTADEALQEGLVDSLGYPDEYEESLSELFSEEPQLVALSDYAPPGRPLAASRVAVVFTQGTIVRGSNGTDPWSQQRFAGSETLGAILRELADDPGVPAVILRVDSPGGSALASDLMLREVIRLAERKPLIVSMSDVAASGGYYIASMATGIVAEPTTITGSIGVVGGKFVLRRFQEDLLGITHDTLARGANADFFSSLDHFSPEQAQHYERLMGRIYDAFVGHVAEGREMTSAAVEAVAQGRIWTGRQALENGLVDQLGGLDVALDLARQQAGLETGESIAIDFYPRPPSLMDFLSQNLEPFLGRPTAESLLLRSLPSAPMPLELPPELLESLVDFD